MRPIYSMSDDELLDLVEAAIEGDAEAERVADQAADELQRRFVALAGDLRVAQGMGWAVGECPA